MLVGCHGKETLVNRKARIDEQNRLRISRFGRRKHTVAVVERTGFAAFAHAHGFRSKLHMRRARHVFGIGDARHKTRRQATRDDRLARRARVDHKHARGAGQNEPRPGFLAVRWQRKSPPIPVSHASASTPSAAGAAGAAAASPMVTYAVFFERSITARFLFLERTRYMLDLLNARSV